MIEQIVLKNVDTGVEIPIAREETPNYILNYVDWGSIQGSQYTYKFVNQIGLYVANKNLETRSVMIAGWIIADNEQLMTELKDKLNRFVNPLEDIELQYKDKCLTFCPETTIHYSRETQTENNEVIVNFTISGTAANPLFLDKEVTIVESGKYTPLFHFPLMINASDFQTSSEPTKHHPESTIVFGKKEENRMLLLNNRGTVPIGMLITIKANASVVNPILTNIRTQEFFKINKTLVKNEEIEIATTIGSKYVRGRIGNGNWSNYFKYRDLQSSWLQLSKGDNEFVYEASSGAANIEIRCEFKNGFVEVEECY